MTVGDRLAPRGQIGTDTEPFPAARRIQAEAGADFVDEQRDALAGPPDWRGGRDVDAALSFLPKQNVLLGQMRVR